MKRQVFRFQVSGLIIALLLLAFGPAAFAKPPALPPGTRLGGNLDANGQSITNAADITTAGGASLTALDGQVTTNTADIAVLQTMAINVKDSPYNAVGDDLANDTAALQAAIDASIASGAPLYIPAGTYKITEQLDYAISSGGRIISGAGENKTIIRQTSVNSNGLVIATTGDVDGLTIHDLFLKGPESGTGCGLKIGPNTANMARLRLDHLNTFGFSTNCWIQDIDQSVIINSRFYGGDVGLFLDNSSGATSVNAVTIVGCVLNGNDNYGAYVASGRGVNFIGCDFGPGLSGCINLLYWAGNAGSVFGCNFEVPQPLDAAIYANATSSILNISDSFFLGQGTTNLPIKVAVGSHINVSGNYMSGFAVGTPFIKALGSSSTIVGQPRFINLTATNVFGGSINIADAETFRLGPIPYKSHANPITTNRYSRGQIFWDLSIANSNEDDLRVIYSKGGDDGTFHSSSLLNDKLLASANVWTVTNTFDKGTYFNDNITLRPSATGDLLLGDYNDIDYATTSDGYGFKICKQAADKMGFWGVAPVNQPDANADTSGATTNQLETEINELKALLREVGFMAP